MSVNSRLARNAKNRLRQGARGDDARQWGGTPLAAGVDPPGGAARGEGADQVATRQPRRLLHHARKAAENRAFRTPFQHRHSNRRPDTPEKRRKSAILGPALAQVATGSDRHHRAGRPRAPGRKVSRRGAGIQPLIRAGRSCEAEEVIFTPFFIRAGTREPDQNRSNGQEWLNSPVFLIRFYGSMVLWFSHIRTRSRTRAHVTRKATEQNRRTVTFQAFSGSTP